MPINISKSQSRETACNIPWQYGCRKAVLYGVDEVHFDPMPPCILRPPPLKARLHSTWWAHIPVPDGE